MISPDPGRQKLTATLGVPLVIAILLAGLTYLVSTATGAAVPMRGGNTGYRILGMHYELHSVDAPQVLAVSFQVEPRPGPSAGGAVRLNQTGAWHPCVFLENQARCNTPGTTVADISELSITING